MVRPTVYTNLSRKRSFSKEFFKPEDFENGTGGHSNPVISLHGSSSNINPCRAFKYSGVMWTKNISGVFKGKVPFSNFFDVV